MASSSPSPLMADVLKMDHVLFLSAESPRAVDISDGVMAPSISCLLANTINIAVFSSSSYSEEEQHIKRTDSGLNSP